MAAKFDGVKTAPERRDTFAFNPDDLTIVTEKSNPLFDERVNLPLVEETTLSIMEHGVILPVVVRKNGPLVEVVDGRQRVRHCREANKRLVAAGQPIKMVPTTLRRDDDSEAFGVMIVTNEHRENDTPLVRARKLKRYLDGGGSMDGAQVLFRCSKSTLATLLALLECSTPLQRAVEEGKLAVDAARELSKLPREDQLAALQELHEKGLTKGKAAVNAARDKAKGKAINGSAAEHRMLSRASIQKLAEDFACFDTQQAVLVCGVLKAILTGSVRGLDDFPTFKETVKAVVPKRAKA